MFKFRKGQAVKENTIFSSKLYDHTNFYNAFLSDLNKAKRLVVIECPFITKRRLDFLTPTFKQLAKHGVRLIINTKPINEHNPTFALDAITGINQLQEIGATVLLTGGHHRKLALIDQRIVWQGSLNILSQSYSCEIMQRIESEQLADQMLTFLHLDKYLTDVV